MRVATLFGLLLLSSCNGWGERRCKVLPSLAGLKAQVFERRLEYLFKGQSISKNVLEFIRDNPNCCSLSKAEDSNHLLTRFNNFWLDSFRYSVTFAFRRDEKIIIRNEFGTINACGEQVEQATFDSWANAPQAQFRAIVRPPTPGHIPQVMIIGKPIPMPLPPGELFPLATAIEMNKARR